MPRKRKKQRQRVSTEEYVGRATEHLRGQKDIDSVHMQQILNMPKAEFAKILSDPEARRRYDAFREKVVRTVFTTVSYPITTSRIVGEIKKDFKGKGSLSAFGFGVGYGTLLHSMKHDKQLRRMFRGRVRGVEMQTAPAEITKEHNLRIHHGIKAEDLGFFSKIGFKPVRVTYSIDFLNSEVIGYEPKVLDAIAANIAKMTAKGGKSYHIVGSKHTALTPKIFERHGLKVEKWERTKEGVLFIKLSK